MNLFIVLITLAARKRVMDNRDTYRSKNGFNFESDDSKFPYDGYQFYGTKKAAIFNYSSEVFRRKKASGTEGLYLIDGGNIPSDMASSASYGGPPNPEDPSPTVSCGLNIGTAGRLEAVTAINLSPNRIAEVPTPCVAPKYPLPDINPEEGKDQKPNFMYMPMYQYSCSSHPRAAGLAHEDNYDCLKKSMNAGNAEGFCCASAAGCMSTVRFFKKTVDLKGNPGWTELTKVFFQVVSCLGSTGGSPIGLPADVTKEGFYREECGYQVSCKSGYSYGLAGTGDVGKLDGPSGAGCATEKIGDSAWVPYLFGVTRLYNISGNTQCDSCKSPGGIVNINGYTDCFYCEQKCWKVDPVTGLAIAPCVDADGTVSKNRIKKKCDDASTGGGSGGPGGSQFCACNFTDTIEFGGTTGTVYVTSFIYPTYMFSNWSPIGLMGNGSLGSTSCNGEFVYNCDEVS